jgi:hypothetical protein
MCEGDKMKRMILGLALLIAVGFLIAGCATGEAKKLTPDATTKVKPECNDRKDNDGDGYCDWSGQRRCNDGSIVGDPDCDDKYDDNESPEIFCGDGTCNGAENCETCPNDCTTTTCGDGYTCFNELCDQSNPDDPYTQAGVCSLCTVNGYNGWRGCRGSGAHVCTDLVTDQYFIDYPLCIPNNNCGGLHFPCNEVICPEPTGNQTNETHLECINEQCVTVPGPRYDDCSIDADCFVNTTCSESDGGLRLYVYGHVWGDYTNGSSYDIWDVCQNNYIILESWCLNHGDTPEVRSYDCRNYENRICEYGVCVLNQSQNETHLACVGEQCVNVSGPGPDECATNQDCVNQTMPDLIILDAYWNQLPNGTGIISTRVWNIGPVSTGTFSFLSFNLSNASYTRHYSEMIPVLSPNQIWVANSSYLMNLNGNYTYYGRADYTDRIVESNELNNEYTTTITIP